MAITSENLLILVWN